MSDLHERAVDAAFKRVGDGYLFQPGICWRLIRSPTYLVNDTQKAAISARLRQNFATMRKTRIAYIVAVGAVSVPLVIAGMELYAAIMIAAVPTGLAFLIAGCVLARRAIEPLLEGLPFTQQHISLTDRLEQQSKVMSWKRSLLLGLACIFGAVVVGSQIDWWFAVAFFLLMAVVQFWVAFLGWKAAKASVRR